MRTSVVVPDEVVAAVRSQIGTGSLSRFVREAIELRLKALERDALLSAMADGYAAETANPSLDEEWNAVEAEELP